MFRNGEARDVHQALQEEVTEIARELLRRKPPGTHRIDVWEEALAIQSRRYVSKEAQ